jgi:hypothetical protein
VLALAVFFGPLIELGRAIKAKRLACDAKLANEQHHLEAERDQTSIGTEQRARLESKLEAIRTDRDLIAKVCSFPLSKSWVPRSILVLVTQVASSSVAMVKQFPTLTQVAEDLLRRSG